MKTKIYHHPHGSEKPRRIRKTLRTTLRYPFQQDHFLKLENIYFRRSFVNKVTHQLVRIRELSGRRRNEAVIQNGSKQLRKTDDKNRNAFNQPLFNCLQEHFGDEANASHKNAGKSIPNKKSEFARTVPHRHMCSHGGMLRAAPHLSPMEPTCMCASCNPGNMRAPFRSITRLPSLKTQDSTVVNVMLQWFADTVRSQVPVGFFQKHYEEVILNAEVSSYHTWPRCSIRSWPTDDRWPGKSG